MFKCRKCHRQTEPKEPQRRIVTETRPRVYLDTKNEVIGRGVEIVKELPACLPCYELWSAVTSAK